MRTQVKGDPQDPKKNPITNDTYILRAMLSGSEVACFSISSPPPSPPPAMFFWRTCGFWLTETFVTGCFRLAHTQLCVVIHHVLLSFFLSLRPDYFDSSYRSKLHFPVLLSNRKKIIRQHRWAPPPSEHKKGKYKNNDFLCCGRLL
jgi:hypothetical protein